jgi:uncharacterized protein (DUF2062 family)
MRFSSWKTIELKIMWTDLNEPMWNGDVPIGFAGVSTGLEI